MVDAGDLKSPELCSCGFESRHPHQFFVTQSILGMVLAEKLPSEGREEKKMLAQLRLEPPRIRSRRYEGLPKLALKD